MSTVDPSTIPYNAAGKAIGPGGTNFDPGYSTVSDIPLAGVTKISTRPWFMDFGNNRVEWLPDYTAGWYPNTAIKSFERHRGKGNVIFFDLHISPTGIADAAIGQNQK